MRAEERRKRLFEPATSHFEYVELLGPGLWYRRGPPCPTCLNYTQQGVTFSRCYEEDAGREECAVCTTLVDVTKGYGPRENGPRVRVLYPPDDDDVENNPYLNPVKESALLRDADYETALVSVGNNDVGNGRRLALRFGEQIRYTAGWGWLVYDGRKWRRDDIGSVTRFAKSVLHDCVAVLNERSERHSLWDSVEADFGVKRKDYETHVRASFSSGRIEAMLKMASSEPEITARTEEFDQESWLLNCKNGIVDLTDGTLRPHDPHLYFTQALPHEYPTIMQPACPRWEAFLHEVCCGDAELVDFLHRAVGYTLTGETKEQKLFFLYGDGANGKSTFLEVLRFVLGDYSTHLSFEALLKSRNSAPEKAWANLPGKRFATSSEAGEARSWNEEAVKAITGGDTIRGEHKYKDSFEFRPAAKIWVAANDRPRIDGVNEGIWRRFFLIPFAAEIPLERRDPGLLKALQEESSGILHWATRGAMRWYREGLRNIPTCMRSAMEDYRSDNDTIARWINDRCLLGPGLAATPAELLKDHNEWAKENHERELTQTTLGTRLAKWKGGARLTKTRIPGNGRFRWEGITTKIHHDREDQGLRGFDRPSAPSSPF